MFSENKTLLNFYFKEINVLPIKTLINTRNKRKTICIFFRRLIAVRQDRGLNPAIVLTFERSLRVGNQISRWFEYQHILSREKTVSNILKRMHVCTLRSICCKRFDVYIRLFLY